MKEKRQNTSSRKRSGNRSLKLVVPIIIAAALISSVAAAAFSRGTNPTNPSQQTLALSTLLASGSASKGSTSAPVTLVEFGDFQCEFCDRYALQTEPQVDQQYVQTGKVAVVFKHFAWYGPDSISAAQAALCANEQGKFWQFHDILYRNQKAINSGWANVSNLKKFALQVQGLDTAKFDTCLDSGKYSSQVQTDTILAKTVGFQGTPGFVIEKSDGSQQVQLPGAYPITDFQQAIDSRLAG